MLFVRFYFFLLDNSPVVYDTVMKVADTWILAAKGDVKG